VTWDNLAKALQIAGAALAIPVAAAGAWSAYRTFFSTDVACQNLKNAIVVTMEKQMTLDAKRALVENDIEDFEKRCSADRHGQDFLKAIRAELEASAQTGGPEPAPVRGPLAGIPVSSLPPVGFAEGPGDERKGWVSLAYTEARSDDINFDGFPISETSLPPPGTVLTARWALPIWREPPAPRSGDLRAAQGRLRRYDCVRVISTRPAHDRLWAEVAPASCP